jgi:NIMA-interacting peptidyl-prolyl cis-trans isomerase 1
VQASHILRKWSGSRRPSSWRVPTVTCSKGEAAREIADMRAAIVAGAATFEQLAATSDCSSARNGGDLGMFARGAMQKPFEDAAFALSVGELSGIVETESGIHIILRTR